MHRQSILAALLAIIIITPLTTTIRAEARSITVAVDLSHGESDKYLDYIIGNITFVNWIKIDAGINSSILSKADVLILGQPTTSLSAEEIKAIVEWLSTGNKVLWVAGDSDYGNGPACQAAVNDLLEAIGAKLRLETGAVYDDHFNAKAYYRVLGIVRPDNIPGMATHIIAGNITKPVLFHGPTAVIWVDENGKPHDPVKEVFPGLVRIVWTSENAYIADNNPPPLTLYNALFDRNRAFVMLAAEYWQDKNVLIVVSGESPYGDYEPGWASYYYGVELDGPQYVTNMIRWFVHIIENRGSLVPPPATVTATVTVTTTKTETVERIVTMVSTVTTTSIMTQPPKTVTETATVTDWGTTATVGVVLLLAGLAVGYLLKKKPAS